MTTIKNPDAIIVGSGAGGSTAARALTQRGFKVVILERGGPSNAEDFIPLDELHFLDHKALIPSKRDDPMLYIDTSKPNGATPQDSERWWITYMVGGSTNQWEANLPRYTDEDFAVTKYLKNIPNDVSMVDWPWTYQEFQPHFERAEWDWGVSGEARQSPVQEPMRAGYDYPMPPIREHGSSPFLRFIFNKAGMFPYRSPRGINSRTNDGRPGCPFCGFCQGFGCASNCRSGAADTVLRKALSTGLCDLRTGHNVLRILFEQTPASDRGHRAIGVEYVTEPKGKPKTLKAPIVIVSIQAIESARLLLLSNIPNENGLIGCYLTYHTKGDLEFTFPNQPFWGSMDPTYPYQPSTLLGSLQLRDLYLVKDSGAPVTKGGKFSIYDPITINPPLKALYRTGMGKAKPSRLWGKPLQDRLVELRENGGVSFSFTGETMSMHDNRVEIADGKNRRPERLDPYGQPVALTYYRHHDYDLALSKYALDRVAEIVGNAGGVLRVNRPQTVSNPGYGHNHGTLRAGRDRGASVLDETCQAHQVEGLYVVDAAFMPTAGASNPSLTMIANAYRVCDRIPKP
jgi:choline dehydrogenase-like flavoprotein